MKRRLFSLVLAFALCLGLTVPVFADGLEDSYETFFGDYEEIYLKKPTPNGGEVGDHFFGHMGLKDRNGNVVIQPEYLQLSIKGNALIATKQVGNWYSTGLIDVNGNILVPFQYYRISSVFWMYQTNHTGYWEVTDPNTCLTGILGPDYSIVIPTMYSDVRILSRDDGYFLVSNTHNADRTNTFDLTHSYSDDQWGVYDKFGNFIIPCVYDDIRYLGDGYFAVRKNELTGVLNYRGEIILPIEYAAPYNNNIYRYENAFTVHKFVSTEYQKRAAAGEKCPDLGELWTTSGIVDANNNVLVDFSKYQTIQVDNSGTFTCGKWTGEYVPARYQISGAPTRYANKYEYDYISYDSLKVTAPSKPTTPDILTIGSFTDVKSTDYFADAVQWAVDKNIAAGTSATTFSPNSTCTRAMTVEYLWKVAGSPTAAKQASFYDVPASADYAQAVAWAVEQGITGGTGGGNFSPAATCTRGQIVTFLHRAMG